MPGYLLPATPVGVMPSSLCTAFSESRSFPVLSQVYKDGYAERGLITDSVNPAVSLKVWKLTKKLTPAAWATLKTFIEGHLSPLPTAFYYYNPFDVAPGYAIGSNYDSTGSNIQGRYVCSFTMPGWSEVVGLARTEVPVEFESTY